MVAKKKVTADAAEKRTAVKTAAEKKEETKAAPKKTAAKKAAAVKSSLYVQYAGKEYTEKELLAAVKKAYTKLGNKASDMKTVEIYLKPEESVAYYVVNGTGSDDFKIEL